MNILVLGGTSFIGPYTVRQLVDRGHEITVFHRGQTEAALPAGVRHIHGDRRRLGDYRGEFRELGPEVVLDTMAMTEGDAQAVMETFTGLAGRLAVLSSADVYRAYDRLTSKDPGPPDPTPLTEESPLREKLYHYRDEAAGPELTNYHYEKILVERLITGQPDALPATVLRLPMVFGPYDQKHRLLPYLKRMDDGRPHILLAEEWASLRTPRGYVGDVAEAIALSVILERAAGRTYNVGYRANYSEEEWIGLLAQVVGWRGSVITVPKAALPWDPRHEMDTRQDWSVDSSRIRRELGYREMVPVGEALRRTVEWERENPLTQVPERLFDYAAEDEVIRRTQAQKL
jgi:nucleoside-diphosphate-sugar epimerase